MMFPNCSIPSISLSLFASVILLHAWIPTTHADKLDVAIARGIMRPTSQVCADYGGTTSFSDVFSSSNSDSNWDSYNAQYEENVFDTEMSHSDPSNDNRTWALRIGKGGQVMSFIGAYGEAIANQGRTVSVWNDLVQQLVVVGTSPSGYKGFIHQSGAYMRDVDGMPPPFYSPKVAFECSDNQCTTVNWGQPSLGVYDNIITSSAYPGDVMFYTRYSNCGDGIIEVDQFIHNFGNDAKTYSNTPWTGVRTSTLKSMMVADGSNNLQNQWPLRDWGKNPMLLTSLRNTGGFTTFAQHISTSSETLIKHTGICRHKDTNAFIDCTNGNAAQYDFIVQQNGTTQNSANPPSTPVGASYSRRAIVLSNLGSAASHLRNAGSHPPDGHLMKNIRTGYEMPIVSVSHFSYYWGGEEKTYIMVDNSITNAEINDKFLAGDGVEFYYAPATGKPVEDNLALTFVHGKAPEYASSRMRVGMGGNMRRDGTIWTTNFMNAISQGSTYFNRKFLITGQYMDVNSQAVPLVTDTPEEVDSISDYANIGEDDISLYYSSEDFGATVGTETCGENNLSCTGSSAPKVGMKPLFYITCGDQRVVSHDPYALNKYGAKLWPWACGGSSAQETRPDYKMLGYFPIGECEEVSDLSYSENFCEPGPPRDTSTTEAQSSLTVNAPDDYNATEICIEIVQVMENSNPNYRNTGCTVSAASPGRRLSVLEVVTSGSVNCPKESANSCVSDFENSVSDTDNYNSISGVTVTGVSVEILPNFDSDINFVSNCTHVEFTEAKASEEISLCYNISDKLATVRLFNKNCTEELTSTGLSINSFDRVDGTPATSNDDLTVKIDVNATSITDITDDGIWSYNANTKVGKIEFCVRLDLMVDSTSINFHENQLTIDVDMTNDFEVVGVSTSREEADLESAETQANYTLNAFQCEDSTGTLSDTVMSQGEVLGLCVEMESSVTGVALAAVSSLDFVQDGGESSSPIVDGEVVGIAEASCEYKEGTLCFIQAIITSKFYNQAYAGMPLRVSGSIQFEFARRRQLDSSLAFANDVEQEDDVPAIQETQRVLQEDPSRGDFSLTINLRETTSVEDPMSSSSKNDESAKNNNAWMMSGVGLALIALFASVSTATYFVLKKRDQREESNEEEEDDEKDVSTKVSSMHLA